MDKESALRIAHQYVDNLSNKYEVLQAFVFGSFAKGTNHEDSDIDIAIVIKNASDIIDTQIDMMKLRRKVDLRIEPHPFKAADFTEENPVVYEILRSGIRLRNK
jgi:predicted nucleotidyltransferase